MKSGNFAGPLLSNTDLKDTTILHMLGLTVIAPKPYYPDGTTEPITKFNVVDASSEDVFTEEPTFGPMDTVNASWYPVVPTAPDEWTQVPKLWAVPDSMGAQQTTVDTWVSAMGWGVNTSADKKVALNGQAPPKLIQGFYSYIMAAPLMTVRVDLL
jgi:hypothetical protein